MAQHGNEGLTKTHEEWVEIRNELDVDLSLLGENEIRMLGMALLFTASDEEIQAHSQSLADLLSSKDPDALTDTERLQLIYYKNGWLN